MPKFVVYHSYYGCETGCCGHTVKCDDGKSEFEFDHPYGTSTEDFVREMVTAAFGAEHCADIDWDNCGVVDD